MLRAKMPRLKGPIYVTIFGLLVLLGMMPQLRDISVPGMLEMALITRRKGLGIDVVGY